jgi:hypothetical protein
MQKKKSTMAYILAALMLSAAVIYFVTAAGESAEAGEGQDREQAPARSEDSDDDNTINSASEQEQSNTEEEGEGQEEEGGLATQVETAFFTIVGLGYAGVGIWVLKDKGKTNTPYIIAIGGSIAMIGLYVASRTIDLPVVGLQEDVGTIDILSKVLQVGIVGLSAYMVNTNKVTRRIENSELHLLPHLIKQD